MTPKEQLAAALKSAKGKGRFPVAPREQRTMDGIVFASKGEMMRYAELKLLERAGKISHLELQPKFPVTINGKPFCTYSADFAYFENGARVVEDVKSTGTLKDTAWRLRKKAAELMFNFRVREV
jgi:hypothetical protein